MKIFKQKKSNIDNMKLWFELPFIKKSNYKIVWTIFAIIVFLSSEVIINITGEKPYLVCRFFYILTVLMWPILYGYIFSHFTRLLTKVLGTIFWENTDACEMWIKTFVMPYLKLKKPIALFVYSVIVSTILVIILFLGMPFQTLFVNITALIGMTIIALISSYGVILLSAIIYTMYVISKKKALFAFTNMNL